MRPIEEAAALWAKSEPDIKFTDRVSYLAQNEDGFVHISPSCFVMALAESFEGKNLWSIEMATGEPYALIRDLPQTLPYIGFRRKCKEDYRIRVYSTQRFLLKCFAYFHAKHFHPC